jgi:hypothetical protein
MAWFKGKLYVGTGRDVMALRYLSPRPMPPLNWPPGDPTKKVPVVPVVLADDPFWHDDGDFVFEEGEGLDTRAQIWRYTLETGEWKRVYWSPWYGPIHAATNEHVGREYGYRCMTVVEEEGALYIGTTVVSPDFGGALVLRTETGDNQDAFKIVSEWPGSDAIRSIVSLNGKLYATPVGQFSATRVVYEGEYDKEKQSISWRPVSQEGFGNLENETIFTLSFFDNHLYAGTLNAYTGFEIWKTDAITPDPDNPGLYKWTKVVTNGAYRTITDKGPLNEAVLDMCSFTDPTTGQKYLYVGGGIESGGYDQSDPAHEVGPGTAEMIRIKPDDTWELVCGLDPGEVRINPETGEEIVPISGMGPGFGDPFTGYFWDIEEHDGWLYVGTFDNSTLLSYIPPEEITDPKLREAVLADPGLIDYIVNGTGGFDIWMTQDGVHWLPFSWTGFQHCFNLGVRRLKSMGEHGLAVGVANEFTATPVPEDGGAQVWVGKPGEIAVPTNVQSNSEARQVKLRWVQSKGAIQYRIIRFTKPSTEPEAIGITKEHFFIDTNVTSESKYEYHILADTGTGVSMLNPDCEYGYGCIGAVAKDLFIFTPGRFTFNRATRQFIQVLAITNNTQSPLVGPIPIVLEGLTSGVMLVNQSTKAQNGSPVITYEPNIRPGEKVQISLKFNNPSFAPIKYVPFLVWGNQTP